MVLYVLNATQLGIQDDNDLLNTVAEQMKSGGKQSKDRFILRLIKLMNSIQKQVKVLAKRFVRLGNTLKKKELKILIYSQYQH